jgi:hypothetical protein
MALTFESYIFNPRPRLPLLLTAKRYQPSSGSDLEDGFTLIFTHGAGFHKEQWEPTIEHLFELQSKNPNGPKIREAWSIDAPNHGEAGVLNEQKLLAGCYDEICKFRWSLSCPELTASPSCLGGLCPRRSRSPHRSGEAHVGRT